MPSKHLCQNQGCALSTGSVCSLKILFIIFSEILLRRIWTVSKEGCKQKKSTHSVYKLHNNVVNKQIEITCSIIISKEAPNGKATLKMLVNICKALAVPMNAVNPSYIQVMSSMLLVWHGRIYSVNQTKCCLFQSTLDAYKNNQKC